MAPAFWEPLLVADAVLSRLLVMPEAILAH